MISILVSKNGIYKITINSLQYGKYEPKKEIIRLKINSKLLWMLGPEFQMQLFGFLFYTFLFFSSKWSQDL